MKKSLTIAILLIPLLLPKKAFALAGDTGWGLASETGSIISEFTNPTNAYVDDTTYATVSFQNTVKKQSYGEFMFDRSVPENATITGIEVEAQFKVNNTSCARQAIVELYKNGSTLYTGGGINHDYIVTNWGTGTADYTHVFDFTAAQSSDLPAFFTPGTITHTGFKVRFNFANGNCFQTYSLDYIKAKVYFDEPAPEVSLDSFTASPSAQLMYIDLSGDTATSGAAISCDVDIFESCSRTGYASWLSETPVATIELDPDYTDNVSLDLGGGRYQGYGYSATSSAWTAVDVVVPYNPGYTCDYIPHTLCTERVVECTDAGCYWTDTIIHADYTGTSIGQVTHGEVFSEPEPDNPLAWIVWKIKQLFWELFNPNFALTEQEYFALQGNLQERAPFAYVYPIFNLDFSDPGGSTATASLSVPVAVSATYIPETIEWTPPSYFDDFMGIFKTGISVMLWLMFIVYIISVARRVL